jgi:hypothetical protein
MSDEKENLRNTKLYSLRPMTFEEAIKKALEAPIEQRKPRKAGAGRKKKPATQ